MNRAFVFAMVVAGASAGSLACSSAFAQGPDENDEGFYLGGGVGQFNLKLDDVNQTDEAIQRLDDSDTSWKAFAGWRMNPYFSLELAYVDFGSPSQRTTTASGSGGDFSASISGFEPSILGTIPLGPVELFGKVGYLFYDVDASVDLDNGPGFDSSSSESDFTYGGGVGMTFFQRLNARLEYQRIDSDVIKDSDAFWFSGAWRF
ncbi:MAG TPA: porin family protein [Steroidobacteraceae bacterium]|nr:porin family protein [Steroidobacteraceae bacterium]